MISDSIPKELNLEILSRLPAKSIARFHSVSKLWASTLDSPHFQDLYLTKSSSPQPRLIFSIKEDAKWSIFSLPQTPHDKDHQKPSSSSSSLVVTPEFHIKFPPDNMCLLGHDHRQFACGYASGLLYFHALCTKNDDVPVICNPRTGRYETLPYIYRYRRSSSFFGFDPIDKQFKVLFIGHPCCCDDQRIMTLGTRGMRWRKIKCSLRLEIVSEGVCINGVLYYLGDTYGWSNDDLESNEKDPNYVIVCFDVRSEKFEFIYPESFCELINYKGKLGLVYYDDFTDDAIELRVWVLEDVEKQEWSKYAYTLRGDGFFPKYVSVVGVISSGEIVLSMADYTSKQPFYVYYFNPELKTIRRVEIQGFGEYHKASKDPSRVYVFLDDCSRFYNFADHVKNLDVNDPKLLNSSIYAPYVYKEEDEVIEEDCDENRMRCFYGKRKKTDDEVEEAGDEDGEDRIRKRRN